MRRSYLFLTVAAALAVGAWFFWPSSSAGQAGYRTEAATPGSVAQVVSANGTLNPVKVVNVGAQISGRISALHADFNDAVKEGQLLAELDDALLKAQLSQSEAQLTSAQAQLRLAQVNDQRARNLASRGAGAKADADTASANLGIAEASVEAARAKVEIDRVNLSYAVIKSPVDGVVMSRDVDVGQTVAASLSAPQIFSIAQDLSKMQIDTTVAEADVGSIKAGMSVTFRVDAFANRSFRGSVRQVRLNPTTESNVVSYNVVIEVDNADLTLLPGMTAYVQITIATEENVLRVANAALRYRPASADATSAVPSTDATGGEQRGQRQRGESSGRSEQGESRTPMRVIYVLDNGEPRAVRVSTGISDGKVTAITGGDLKEGDLVIIGAAATGTSTGTSTTNRMTGPRMF